MTLMVILFFTIKFKGDKRNMFEINEEYASALLEKPLKKYKKDGNVYNLINDLAMKDNDLIPLALFFALKMDFAKDMEMLKTTKLDESQSKLNTMLNSQKNKQTVNKVHQIMVANDPFIQKLMESANKEDIDNELKE